MKASGAVPDASKEYISWLFTNPGINEQITNMLALTCNADIE